MCGIIAIVRSRSHRSPPAQAELVALLEPAPAMLRDARAAELAGELTGALSSVAERLEAVDHLLRGAPGVQALLTDRALAASIEGTCDALVAEVAGIEASLDVGALPSTGPTGPAGSDLELLNAAVVRAKDALWAVARDRLRTARAVADMCGPEPGIASIETYLSIQQALSSLDRLEVRGRDSAGLMVLVRGHGLDLDAPGIAGTIEQRRDPLFTSSAVRVVEGCLSFAYKAAAEIGDLGDNTRSLREAITADGLLRQALATSGAQSIVLGHTRWASVGIISQPNAHPLNSDEVDRAEGPYVTAVLNGDVDNFADLKANDALRIPNEITTDAKVIPTLTSRAIAGGADPVEAFRSTANRLEGSVAIAAVTAAAPDELLLAIRGSGQALYVGLADDLFIVASEPYGVVEETHTYLRMDGETPADPESPTSTRGQIVRLRQAAAGTLEGIERWAYDGMPVPVGAGEPATAQITTRDIDRGKFPHFLLKEISESPSSFRKTLRGKLVDVGGEPAVNLGDGAFPPSVRDALREGRITRVAVIGQGTAAVAGQSLALALESAMGPGAALQVQAQLATELSGFSMREDMSNLLVIAISQSGTTTDTNRTVDLVRARGASVIAIVNRRNSDLTDRCDGVLYTSDGRDVEMSVASTKAFYSQIAAGFLLAIAIAGEVGSVGGFDVREVLEGLRELPGLMERTLECRPALAEAAQRFAPSRRYWAIVGNGANRIAANEVRIKLSELCYKSIACDGTEDKKHIDLSSEPMILVCAAGLAGSTADDVAKEVAIYRAHKAAPVVLASEGEERYSAALLVVYLPSTHPALAFVLSAMAGHLFGYEAALAIDAQARPLREVRAAVESLLSSLSGVAAADLMLEQLAPLIEPPVSKFFDELRSGDLDGQLEASSAVRLASLFRYALGITPLETYQIEYGKVGTPSVVIEDLTSALTKAIDEMTRPVDAIKHQAKTVTVGISRSDETLLQSLLVREVLAAGASRDRLSYQSLRTVAVLDPLVDEVLGYTRYRIEGRAGAAADEAHIYVVDRGGIGRELQSRTDGNPLLRGTKHRVATERLPLLARGRSDGRTVLIVPEVKDAQTTGLSLLHLRLRTEVPLPGLRTVLQGYRGRYQALKDAVTETEPTFRDDLMSEIPILELMTDPINDLAERWR